MPPSRPHRHELPALKVRAFARHPECGSVNAWDAGSFSRLPPPAPTLLLSQPFPRFVSHHRGAVHGAAEINTIDLQWEIGVNFNARPCAGERKAAGPRTMGINGKTMRRTMETVGNPGRLPTSGCGAGRRVPALRASGGRTHRACSQDSWMSLGANPSFHARNNEITFFAASLRA
jgi:hypothetical protein